ncbi:MAG: hypothetical protein J0H99_15370, partial [Rhodospirillales bacterium]|nr:hypothetical protein [Rhodospirillales bacterium]
MSSATASPARRRTRRTVARIVLALLVAVAVWQGWVHASAWRSLKEARAALQRDDPAEARRHAERCLETWPRSGEATFLAAQAARRGGDLEAAEKYLLAANRLGRAADDVEVEYALVRTQSGHFAEAESALLNHLNSGHPESPQILA